MRSQRFCPPLLDKNRNYEGIYNNQIKENCSLSPILKMRRFSCLLRLSLPPEMGEIAQTFMSEIEWLSALKCRATGLSTSLFLTEQRYSI